MSRFRARVVRPMIYKQPLVAGVDGGSVSISWDAITLDTEGNALTPANYKIYAGGSEATLTEVTTVSGATLTYTFTGLSAGTYYFAVKAVDSGGVESAMSPFVTATVT